MIHPKHWWQIYFTLPSKDKKKKSNAKRIPNTAFVVSDKIFHCQLANSMSGSHFSSLTVHRTEKNTQKTKVPTPGRKGQFNDKAGIVQIMPWSLQSPGQALTGKGHKKLFQWKHLVVSPCTWSMSCPCSSQRAELQLPALQWTTAASRCQDGPAIPTLSHYTKCQVFHVPAEQLL